MSQESVEIVSPPQQQPPITEKTVTEDLLEEVRNLKKAIKQIAEREAARQKQTNLHQNPQTQVEQANPQSEVLQSKIPKQVPGEGRARGGTDIYRNFKNQWKVRMASKPKPVLHSLREERDNFLPKNEEQKVANLEQSIIKHLSFTNSRSDTDEQQPVRTQFFTPETRHTPSQSGELRFRKTDIIPMIQNDRNRFRSYITAQKNNISTQKNERMQPARQSYSKSKEMSLVEKVQKVQINRQSDKAALIAGGKQLLSLLYDRFTEQTPFSIKKYKNCLVFSLLPITKAIIYHYSGDIYFGGVSQDQQGKISKNGPGVEIVKGRHLYEGHFIDGKKNGRGKIIYENGDKYEGQWAEGEIYGYGRFDDGKKGGVFEGLWKKGEFYGDRKKQSTPFQFQ